MPASFPSGCFLFESEKKWHWFQKKKHKNGGKVVKIISTWWQGPTKTCLLTGPFKRKSPSWVLSPTAGTCRFVLGNSLTHLSELWGNFLLCVLNYGYQVILRWDPIWAGCHVCWCLFKKNFPSSSFTHFQWLVYGVWLAGLLMCFFLQYILTYIVQRRKFAWNKSSCDVHSHRIILSQRQQYKPTAEREEGASMFPNPFMENHSHSNAASFFWWVVGLAFETLALV